MNELTRYAMIIDLGRCIGCRACVAACIAENLNSETSAVSANSFLLKLAGLNPEIPPAEFILEKAAAEEDPEKSKEIIEEELWTRTYVYPIVTGKYPDVNLCFYHVMCQHCDDAPCVAVCPTGASYQREDGIVLVDANKCILCGYCVTACPYAARKVNSISRTIDKRTFCSHRVDRGLEPACVETCPSHARVFGDLDDPESEVHRRIRVNHEGVPGTPIGPIRDTKARVYYIHPHKRGE